MRGFQHQIQENLFINHSFFPENPNAFLKRGVAREKPHLLRLEHCSGYRMGNIGTFHQKVRMFTP